MMDGGGEGVCRGVVCVSEVNELLIEMYGRCRSKPGENVKERKKMKIFRERGGHFYRCPGGSSGKPREGKFVPQRTG